MNTSLRALILLLACLSPLLTFASLWQLKEWRIDRLREHLNTEGWLRQLFGLLRPLIVLLAIVLLATPLPNALLIDTTLVVLAIMNVSQMVLQKQRLPVWTSKAILLTVLSLLITTAASTPSLLAQHHSLLEIPLLQPVALFLAWLLMLPLDQFLKKRIMRRAKALLATYTNVTVIGITGSVGKTTTKELIAHAMAEHDVLFTPAYVNSEMGVSQWLLHELPKRDQEATFTLIVEMGAYKKGEIQTLCDITKPTIGIITYVGTQHIALFGSQEKLAEAKAELLESLPEDGLAFVNGDCELCRSITSKAACPVRIVGTAGENDLEALDILEEADGMHFRVGDTPFLCPLHGTHNITNVLLMIGVCTELGMDEKEIATRTRSFTPPHHTFDVRQEHGVTVLDDTHNASPESFRAAIAWAKTNPSKFKVLLTPGLIELGNRSSHIHRDLGSQAAPVFDQVIFTSKNGYDAFAEGFGRNVRRYTNPISTVASGTLLVCVGRVGQSKIRNLLP